MSGDAAEDEEDPMFVIAAKQIPDPCVANGQWYYGAIDPVPCGMIETMSNIYLYDNSCDKFCKKALSCFLFTMECAFLSVILLYAKDLTRVYAMIYYIVNIKSENMNS